MISAKGLTVLILAGGDGTRIGGSKPLQALRGQTLLDHALEKARLWSSDIAIAVRAPEQVGATECPIVIDAPGISGPLAGLGAARRLGGDMVLTMPCDMPFLPADLPARLQAAIGEAGAALAASEGRIHPVCGLWRGDRLAGLDGYLASGRRSMIGFAEQVGYVPVELPVEACFNINTPADLATAESRKV